MDTERFSELIERGRLTLWQSRSSRAQLAAARFRNSRIRDELQVFVHTSATRNALLGEPAENAGPGSPSSEPAWLRELGYYRLAETAIDEHGRWARHVVLQRAIDQLMAGDVIGETVWRRVFTAILALQHRTREGLTSGA
jgi:hypothetical protein